MTDWANLIEPGRAIVASRLDRVAKVAADDWKFAIGDLVADVPDNDLHDIASAVGAPLDGKNLREYRDVAEAWPIETRIGNSWTAHRTLEKDPNRFELIRPKMTLRQAQMALGKIPSDHKHPSRWPAEQRVAYLISQLLDTETNHAVRAQLDDRKKARSAKATARAVEEDQSAEYRAALREFREARDAKRPELAAYEALFKVRNAAEYVRATGKATSGENSFLPKQMRPDLTIAVRDLALTSVDVLASLMDDEPAAAEALGSVSKHLDEVRHPEMPTGFNGMIISSDPVDDDSDPESDSA